MRMIAMLLAALMALTGFTASASASEGRGQPFITAAHYQENITIEQFRENPRSYFRSEAAFDLIVDYVGDEIGVDLTDAQFVALVRDAERTRVRNCGRSERINTGALDGNQFHWFVRPCRSGEQIVETLVNGVWIDLFSLGCLNAVEDPNPVAPPTIDVPTGELQITTIVPPTITTSVVPGSETDVPAFPYYGWGVPAPTYGGGNNSIIVGSRSGSTATNNNPGCTSQCQPRTH